LFFGDATTGDYKINAVNMNAALTKLTFGGTGYDDSTQLNVPFVGVLDLSTNVVQWVTYYKSTSYTLTNVMNIIYGYSQNYLLVSFMSDFLFVRMSSTDGSVDLAQLIIGSDSDTIFKASTISDKFDHIVMGYMRAPNKYRVAHVFANDWYSEIDVTNNIPASLATWDNDIIVAAHIESGGTYYIALNSYAIGGGILTTSSSAFQLNSVVPQQNLFV
jgi:hypothetical protein